MSDKVVTGAVTIKQFFAGSHLVSAAIHARRAKEVEALGKLETHGEHRAAVVAAVVLAASFLETLANEFFATCAAPEFCTWIQSLPGDRVELAGRLWEKPLAMPRTALYSVFEKYELALALFGLAPLDRGRSPNQDVTVLLALRNELVHAEPSSSVVHSSIPELPVTEHRFERMAANRFALNPLMPAANPFFPDRMLSAGCAAWAVRSALAFADSFFATLGVPAPPYELHRKHASV